MRRPVSAGAGVSRTVTTYATTTATITRGITVSPSLPSSSVARSTEIIGSRSIATHMAPTPIANPP